MWMSESDAQKKLLSASSYWLYVRCSTGSQSNFIRNLVNGVKSSRGCVLTSQEEGRDIDVTLGNPLQSRCNTAAHVCPSVLKGPNTVSPSRRAHPSRSRDTTIFRTLLQCSWWGNWNSCLQISMLHSMETDADRENEWRIAMARSAPLSYSSDGIASAYLRCGK